jgi:hypothetical protein
VVAGVWPENVYAELQRHFDQKEHAIRQLGLPGGWTCPATHGVGFATNAQREGGIFAFVIMCAWKLQENYGA